MAQTAVTFVRWVYVAALITVVFIASGRSQVATPQVIGIDKLAHFGVFGLLATLVLRSPGIRGRAWLALVLTAVWGLADEFRQSFTPGRFVEVADWWADTAGAALAVTLYARWPFYRHCLEWPLRWPRRGLSASSETIPAA
jgi:VanZ family protein